MRLICKLAIVLVIGVGTQVMINRHANDIDEAQFTIRVFVAHLRGGVATDPGVMDMAVALRDRQIDRNNQRVNAIRAATAGAGCDAGAAHASDRKTTTRPAGVGRDASREIDLEAWLEADGAVASSSHPSDWPHATHPAE